ncbi:MAG: S9 family peptidase [Chitinophagia bacterium]|nr:S9 family peptidase [Chitinophagia bacterium]
MHKTLCTALAIICAAASFGQDKKNITLEDLYKNFTFAVKDVPGFNALHDGQRYTRLDEVNGRQLIRVFDLQTGKELNTIFDNSLLKAPYNNVKIEAYAFSEQEDKVLLFTENQNVYRRSVLSRVYVFDIATGTVTPLDDQKVLHATFSPDGVNVAFVKNNNLYIRNLNTNQVTAVTADGETNKVINGNCDWVYEEEFSFSRAFEWNSDGSCLAYYRFDEREVPYFTMAKYGGLYPEQYTFKYPKAGEKNSVIQIRMYHVASGKTVTADIGPERDQYIPQIQWTTNPRQLCITRLNRLQNHLELLLTLSQDGTTKVIYNESNARYINVDDKVEFLPDNKSLLFTSQRDGYNHIYWYNWNKRQLKDLTPGKYDISSIVSVNTDQNLVYYTAAESSPLVRNLYSVQYRTGDITCITKQKGTHVITPCAGNRFFLDKCSRIDAVPVYNLIDSRGQLVRTLEDNKALAEKMTQYALGHIGLTKIKCPTNTLNAWMITPPDFDSNKKYPVLMYQYSGPGSQEVADRFPVGNFWWHQMLAEKGYIVLCVDGTGTGFRGEEFCKKTYLQLGKYESDDQIAAARVVGKWKFVDASRIGIWGWSYGGFMSSTCLMKGNDVFKAAIAVAPVTNWRYYDNIYTERYMRTPQENPDGYDNNSPVKMVNGLKGKYLLIHGTADDNVHFQNSVMLVDALIKANKDFDSEYYPDKNHGISGGNTRLHLYRRMTNFILENL